jgi:hypothetical protein
MQPQPPQRRKLKLQQMPNKQQSMQQHKHKQR